MILEIVWFRTKIVSIKYIIITLSRDIIIATLLLLLLAVVQ